LALSSTFEAKLSGTLLAIACYPDHYFGDHTHETEN